MKDLDQLAREHGVQPARYQEDADAAARRSRRRYPGERPPATPLVDAEHQPPGSGRAPARSAPKRARRATARPVPIPDVTVSDHEAAEPDNARRRYLYQVVLGWRLAQAREALCLGRVLVARTMEMITIGVMAIEEGGGSLITFESVLKFCQLYQITPERLLRGITKEVARVYKLGAHYGDFTEHPYTGPGWTPALRPGAASPAADRPDPGGA